MENDPPGIETMPLTPAQIAARAKRVEAGLASMRRQKMLASSGAGAAAESCKPTQALPAFEAAAAPRSVPFHMALSIEQEKQIAAVALAAAMKRHGDAFRLRVLSQRDWDAVVALRMRNDNCDRQTAQDREYFVSPFLNVRG